jgi:hypothetical protein
LKIENPENDDETEESKDVNEEIIEEKPSILTTLLLSKSKNQDFAVDF